MHQDETNLCPFPDRKIEALRLAQLCNRRIGPEQAINETLGTAAALRFLSLLHCEPTDYVDVSRRLYANQTIDDIFDRARQNWPAEFPDTD
jgi:hypothetical protein